MTELLTRVDTKEENKPKSRFGRTYTKRQQTFDEDVLLDRPAFCIPSFAPATTLPPLPSDTSALESDTGADASDRPSCSVQILGNLTILTINMDGGARWNYTLVCDLILCKKADIAILIDTRLNKFGGSQSKLIIRQLGSTYTVHVHSAGDKNEIGGVMFISGPRLSHKRLRPLCPLGSTAALTCTLGGTRLSVMATYWPTKNDKKEAGGSLWNRMSSAGAANPITQIEAMIIAHLAEYADHTHILGGDFNTDVNRGDPYSLTHFLEEQRLIHSSSLADLKIPTYIRTSTSVATRLDYQHGGRVLLHSHRRLCWFDWASPALGEIQNLLQPDRHSSQICPSAQIQRH